MNGTLVPVKVYKREHIHARPLILVLFGDNLMGCGYGGQARECRGLHNCQGIVTRYDPYVYLTDDHFELVKAVNLNAFRRATQFLDAGGTVAIPFYGIGTGRAKLAEKAPRIMAEVVRCMEVLRNRAAEIMPANNLLQVSAKTQMI